MADDDHHLGTSVTADNEPFYAPGRNAPKRHPKPGELLCEFTRGSDGAPMSIELRYHGDAGGWEAQILERGELFASHGAFGTRALAENWAELERKAIEKGTRST
jgi:hypothetical protein